MVFNNNTSLCLVRVSIYSRMRMETQRLLSYLSPKQSVRGLNLRSTSTPLLAYLKKTTNPLRETKTLVRREMESKEPNSEAVKSLIRPVGWGVRGVRTNRPHAGEGPPFHAGSGRGRERGIVHIPMGLRAVRAREKKEICQSLKWYLPPKKKLFCAGSCQMYLHRYCASVSEQAYKELSAEDAEPFLCYCGFRSKEAQIESLQGIVETLKAEIQSLKAASSSNAASNSAIYSDAVRGDRSVTISSFQLTLRTRDRLLEILLDSLYIVRYLYLVLPSPDKSTSLCMGWRMFSWHV